MQRIRRIHSLDQSTRPMIGSSQIITVVWMGTLALIIGILLLLIASTIIFHNYYVMDRILTALAVLIYLSVTGFLLKRGYYRATAVMILSLYTLLAILILTLWGVNASVGILALAFVVFLSGVMLGEKYLILVTAGTVTLLVGLCVLDITDIIHPDRDYLLLKPTIIQVLTYGTAFAIYAFISRLARRQIEQALAKARAAEHALQKEKDSLQIKLAEQTRALREAQLDEMQQLYRFAEIGQLTTVMLHDIANSLSVLTLDVDDLGNGKQSAKATQRVKESISYLDTVVRDLRKRLRNHNNSIKFNALKIIEATLQELQPKANRRSIELILKRASRPSFYVHGDPLRLSQCLTILINNAIDAYPEVSKSNNKIMVSLAIKRRSLVIAVIDYGKGIPQSVRSELFSPLKSTKKNGMGIGLFVTKQIIETHFKGTIRLDSRQDRTEFVMSLPEYR